MSGLSGSGTIATAYPLSNFMCGNMLETRGDDLQVYANGILNGKPGDWWLVLIDWPAEPAGRLLGASKPGSNDIVSTGYGGIGTFGVVKQVDDVDDVVIQRTALTGSSFANSVMTLNLGPGMGFFCSSCS